MKNISCTTVHMVSSSGIHSKSQLNLIRSSYFHLIRSPVCLNLTFKVFHFMATSLSKLTLLLPPLHMLFPKHQIYYLFLQQASASLPPTLGLRLFFFLSKMPFQPLTSENPGSTSNTSIKASKIPSARCNHTFSCGPKGFLPVLLFQNSSLTTFYHAIQSFTSHRESIFNSSYSFHGALSKPLSQSAINKGLLY